MGIFKSLTVFYIWAKLNNISPERKTFGVRLSLNIELVIIRERNKEKFP